MVYRGYLLNRINDLLGRNIYGSLGSLFFSTLIFVLAHGNYRAGFLVTSSIMGLIEGCMYLLWKRNLWMPILIHGIANSTAYILGFASAI